MHRSPAFALIWLLAIVLGGSPPASPSAAIRPVTTALRHGETRAAPAIYVPARTQRLQAVLPGPSSHPRHTSPPADLLRSRLGETPLFGGRVNAPTRGVSEPAASSRHGFPRFPTGPPSHV